MAAVPRSFDGAADASTSGVLVVWEVSAPIVAVVDKICANAGVSRAVGADASSCVEESGLFCVPAPDDASRESDCAASGEAGAEAIAGRSNSFDSESTGLDVVAGEALVAE